MNSDRSQQDRLDYGFTRALSLFDVIFMGMNSMIGAGIFLLPGQMCSLVGSGAIFIFPMCGLLCFFIALCFAEMGGIYSGTGGAYLYARDNLGDFVGFWVGWMMWLSSIIGWASVSNGFGLYLNYFLPAGMAWLSKVFVALLVIGLSAINYFGVKPGAWTINFFTIGKLLSLGIFAGIGLFFVKGENLLPLHLKDTSNLSVAVVTALYAYTGFEFVGVPAGEMKNPKRDIPRVIFFILLMTTVLYAVIQLVATGTFPGLAGSDSPLADAARYFMGETGAMLIGMGALLSIGGINAGIALTSPRSLYVLSREGFFPGVFSKIHPKYRTPHIAILLNMILTTTLSLTGSFMYLVEASVLVSILQYIPTCLAVIVMRRNKPGRKGSYRMPGGYCIPLLALLICAWLLYHVELKVIIATAMAAGVFLPIYFLRRKT